MGMSINFLGLISKSHRGLETGCTTQYDLFLEGRKSSFADISSWYLISNSKCSVGAFCAVTRSASEQECLAIEKRWNLRKKTILRKLLKLVRKRCHVAKFSLSL